MEWSPGAASSKSSPVKQRFHGLLVCLFIVMNRPQAEVVPGERNTYVVFPRTGHVQAETCQGGCRRGSCLRKQNWGVGDFKKGGGELEEVGCCVFKTFRSE